MRSRTCGLHRCTASSTTLTSSLTKSKAWANRKMILERQDLAWVKSADGRLTPFDEARLIASIQTAARRAGHENELLAESVAGAIPPATRSRDRKSTRLNSSHTVISYAVF